MLEKAIQNKSNQTQPKVVQKEEVSEADLEMNELKELLMKMKISKGQIGDLATKLYEGGINAENFVELVDSELLKDLQIPAGHSRLILSYLESQKDNQVIDTTTTVSSSASSSSIEVPLPNGKEFHVFVGHAWGKEDANHKRALKLATELENVGLKVWIDAEKLEGDVEKQIGDGLRKSMFYLACIQEDYIQKVEVDKEGVDWCQHEWRTAFQSHGVKRTIPVVMSPTCLDPKQWTEGLVKDHLGLVLYVDASEEIKFGSAAKDIQHRVKSALQQ